MKARHQKKFIPWYEKWWGGVLIALIVLGLILLLVSSFIVFKKVEEIRKEAAEESLRVSTENYLKRINGQGDNYYLGAKKNSTNKVLEVIVFSNFSCYYSSLSSLTINKILEKHGDLVRFVFRDSPEPDSIISSIGARCAGEQGKFWEMHDLIFELQEDLSLISSEEEKKEALIQMSEIIKLNTSLFANCLNEKRYLDKIKKDYEDGYSLNIKGTPTWFINGVQITGGLSEDKFEELLVGLEYIN